MAIILYIILFFIAASIAWALIKLLWEVLQYVLAFAIVVVGGYFAIKWGYFLIVNYYKPILIGFGILLVIGYFMERSNSKNEKEFKAFWNSHCKQLGFISKEQLYSKLADFKDRTYNSEFDELVSEQLTTLSSEIDSKLDGEIITLVNQHNILSKEDLDKKRYSVSNITHINPFSEFVSTAVSALENRNKVEKINLDKVTLYKSVSNGSKFSKVIDGGEIELD